MAATKHATKLEAVVNFDGTCKAAVDIALRVGWTRSEIAEHVQDDVGERGQSLASAQRKKTHKVLNGKELIYLRLE